MDQSAAATVRYLYLSAERLREARRSEGQAAGGADRGDAGTYQKGEWRAPATLSLPHDPYICGPADLPAANAETKWRTKSETLPAAGGDAEERGPAALLFHAGIQGGTAHLHRRPEGASTFCDSHCHASVTSRVVGVTVEALQAASDEMHPLRLRRGMSADTLQPKTHTMSCYAVFE